MKKAILMITAALALLLGCNESLSLLTKITITSEVKEVYVGGTLQLTASVEPADVPEAVVWSSSDEKTATVDQKGVVTGIKEGAVTVKLASKADENMCDTVEITVVKNPNPVTVASVVIMDGETSLSEELTVKVEAGENGAYTQEKAFTAVVNFSDGSEGRYDETVSWSLVESQPEGAFVLSAEGVLSFTLSEKTGTDAALGSAEIEAVSNYDGTTKTAVRITMLDASAPDSLEIVDESGYGFEGGTLALFEGGSGVTAQVFVNPTSKPQEAVWSVEPAGAVEILLPEETVVGESAVAKVLLKRGEVGEDVVDAVVTVTQDGVSASLSVSFPEAAITLGGYEDNRWIEGETLTLTAADASFDIASIDGTTVVGDVWTVPAPAAGDSEDKSIECECLSVYGESFMVSVTGKVYSSEHIRYDGGVFKTVKEFDFTDENTLNDVKDGENAIDSVGEEGYVFSISPTGKKSLNFSLIDSENIVLTMIEAKWDRNNCANIFVAGGGNADYGWSPFKGNYSFMLGVAASGENSGQRWNSKNDHVRLSVNPTENTFNKYFVFDNGVDNATLGFNDEVRSTTAAITSKGAINRISSISSNGAWPLTFQHANGDDKTNPVTYTIKTVAFYKAAE